MKKTIAIDFDGTLSAYQGWKGPLVLDEPLPGAIPWLRELIPQFQVVIFTTRAETPEGIEVLKSWFWAHGLSQKELDQIQITDRKLPAWLYIDDRCYLFTGTFPSAEQINAFQPWWTDPGPRGPDAL